MDRRAILEEAVKCVTKDRNATHGEPEDNFLVIAKFWSTYLDGVRKQRVRMGNDSMDLTSVDVSVMMILMKASRLITSPEHPDHWVDSAGYAACGGGIATLHKLAPGTVVPR